MTAHSRVFHQLQGALAELMRLGLAVSTRPVVYDYGDHGLIRITWAGYDDPPDQVNPFQMSLASIPQYLAFLRSGAYNAVLMDGALVQVSYNVCDEAVVGHRLCYHPCPFDLADWDIGSAGDVLDAAEALADSVADGVDDLELVRLQGPVRFDFDNENCRPMHGGSHLHLASAECRLPVFGPVSVGQFFRFLLRSYYPGVWLEDERARAWAMDHLGRRVSDEDRVDLFLECHDRL